MYWWFGELKPNSKKFEALIDNLIGGPFIDFNEGAFGLKAQGTFAMAEVLRTELRIGSTSTSQWKRHRIP